MYPEGDMLRILFALLFCAAAWWAQPLPIRGIHLAVPNPDEIPLAARFIKEALPKEGVKSWCWNSITATSSPNSRR